MLWQPKELNDKASRTKPDDLTSRIKTSERGCWEWQGERSKRGYGVFRGARAHRISFFIFRRQEWDPDLLVCHKCDNPCCINPDHLSLGTHRDNFHDMKSKNRETTHLAWEANLKKFDQSQIDEMVALYSIQGYSYRKIAEKYGITHYLVKRVISPLTPQLRRGKKLNENMINEIRTCGLPTGEIAKKYGIHPNTVSAIRRKRRWL